MHNLLQTRGGDLGLRAIGLVALGSSYLLTRSIHPTGGSATLLTILAAGAAFVMGSLGAAALIHGRHLLDQVEVSGRWRRQI